MTAAAQVDELRVKLMQAEQGINLARSPVARRAARVTLEDARAAYRRVFRQARKEGLVS